MHKMDQNLRTYGFINLTLQIKKVFGVKVERFIGSMLQTKVRLEIKTVRL